MERDGRHAELTKKIIGAAFAVHNQLGFGFAEKVYENALVIELKKLALDVAQQAAINVLYDGQVVGDYIADLVVNGVVIVEVKAVAELDKTHEVQLVNYLKATGIEVGLLINFGRTVTVRRKIFDRT